MTKKTTNLLITGYWKAMNSNEWRTVAGEYLATDFVCLWPYPYPVPDWRKGMLVTDPDEARF